MFIIDGDLSLNFFSPLSAMRPLLSCASSSPAMFVPQDRFPSFKIAGKPGAASLMNAFPLPRRPLKDRWLLEHLSRRAQLTVQDSLHLSEIFCAIAMTSCVRETCNGFLHRLLDFLLQIVPLRASLNLRVPLGIVGKNALSKVQMSLFFSLRAHAPASTYI